MRGSALAIVTATVVAAIGCASTSAPALHPRKLEALETNASHSLRCPRDRIAYTPFAEGRHLFRGCGREIELVLVTEARGPAGAEHGSAIAAASNVFARETGCPLRETSLAVLDADTESVTGCGKSVTYVHTCDETTCRWHPETTVTVHIAD